MRNRGVLIAIAALYLQVFPITQSQSAGSTIPVFQIDATNTSNYTLSGSSLGSTVYESANAVSGTATSVTLDSNSPTPSFNFSGSGYMNFGNNVNLFNLLPR